MRILRGGRVVTTLRGAAAREFRAAAEAAGVTPAEVQALCARVTGNDRRGNERVARNHPRNRGGQAGAAGGRRRSSSPRQRHAR